MPVTLGLGAAGKAASALGGSGKAGPTSTKNVTGTSTQLGTGSSGSVQGSNLSPLMAGFQNSLVPALSSLYAKAQTPVYGAQQIAQVANQGDAATNAASQALNSNLARTGSLNSGANAAGQTALQAANTANTVGFENNIPLLNYQNEMAQTGNVLGLAEGLTGKALSTTTSTGSGGTNVLGGTNSTTTESGPAFGASMLGQTGNYLNNAAAGGGGKMGGGGKGGGSAVSPGLDLSGPIFSSGVASDPTAGGG